MNKVSQYTTSAFVALTALSTNALAEDPQWFTDLSTEIGDIGLMAGTALGAVIGVKLVPLAWRYIAPIIGRG